MLAAPCRRARTVTGGAIGREALDCRHGGGGAVIKPGEALHRNRCHCRIEALDAARDCVILSP
jgi:hypothetical protein